MAFTVSYADRILNLPPYVFAQIDAMKRKAIEEGRDIINLGVGDPDGATPDFVVERLRETAVNADYHHYPSYVGLMDFRKAVAEYYSKMNAVTLDPATEVLALIGSKEGVGHVPLAYVNPGDVVLVPDPGYPVYDSGTLFAGGISHIMPLLRENGFLPDLDAIPANVARKAKLMFINYPNNPTGAVCGIEFFEKIVAFAREYNIIVVHDAAYADVTFDGFRAQSFLEVPGAKEVGIELYSLSKTYNMTGWRIAAAVGSAEILAGLGKVKTNLDSGVFEPIQLAAISALASDQSFVAKNNAIYQERRDILVGGLKKLGWDVDMPKGTFYVWIPVPKGMTSSETTALLIAEAAVVTTPGNGFGQHGEGFIRMTITTSKERLEETIDRLAKISF